VSGVAHHLKNIILSVKGPIGLIRMGLKMGKMDLIEQSVPIMERGSARMEQSVKEMLDYSKDREPDLELGNLGELLREIVDGCKTRAANAGIDLQLRVEENLADSMLDKFRLHDAILNIVGNAIEAQPAGAENPWIRVSAWTAKSGDRHLIEIRDNGPGIPPDVLARIFQPFFSTKGSKGTGLGLAVAQKVAEENGGSLSVENEFGKGAVFTFQLAVRPPRVESPSKSNQEAPLS
jgi:signal transduction histidine kinase